MVAVAEEHCPAALSQARDLEKKYKNVLLLFYECHKIYNSKYVTDADIDELGM